MGTTTPNIGIFIPAAGETLYADSFNAGMINIDQHDHSGAPNKGIPIGTSGIGAGSVTYDKLNINVAATATGIGTSGSSPNQLVLLGCLPNLFNYGFDVFITKNGDNIQTRQFQDTTTIKWTNGSGAGAQGVNPSAEVLMSGLRPIAVTDGGTGVLALNAWDIICGGTVANGPVQQVSGEGLATQVLTSNGPLALPTWQAVPYPAQNALKSTIILNQAQCNNISTVPVTIVAAPGAGKVIVPLEAWGKLNYGGVAAFGGGSPKLQLFYTDDSSSNNFTDFACSSNAFQDTFNSYYYFQNTRANNSSGIPIVNMENAPLVVQSSSSNLTGGAGNSISIFVIYTIMQI